MAPEALNGGNLVDVFQHREDDFQAVDTLEVSYATPGGEKTQELVFCDSKGRGPRILVPESWTGSTEHRRHFNQAVLEVLVEVISK